MKILILARKTNKLLHSYYIRYARFKQRQCMVTINILAYLMQIVFVKKTMCRHSKNWV